MAEQLATHKKLSTKVLIWDFDQTILRGLHTGGCANEKKIQKAIQSVSPDFVEFVTQLPQHIPLGVATYADRLMVDDSDSENEKGGEDLVEEVLKGSLPPDVAKRFIIAAAYPRLHADMPKGKGWHIDKILTALEKERGSRPAPADVVLFDDDTNNVQLANRDGYIGVTVDHKVGFRLDDVQAVLDASQ